MESSHRFARRVFFWAGIYGLAVLLPQFFLEEALGRRFPPPFNRPEQFYGFLGVTVAWQLAFLVVSRDVVRFRPLMPVAAVAKLSFVAALAALGLAGRVPAATVAAGAPDLLLALLFLLAWRRCGSGSVSRSTAGSGDLP